ncbi:MAG: TauD/TfdA family dioxygenase, partial [Pseudomonadota bacterium]|nr:TauD/TfdA family dioxygenase [Pseudomonadota bacterium]
MAISVEHLSSAIGARLTGIDLSSVLEDRVMREIRQAWLNHFVVVMPGQDVSGEDQIAFTEWFGPRQEVRTV